MVVAVNHLDVKTPLAGGGTGVSVEGLIQFLGSHL